MSARVSTTLSSVLMASLLLSAQPATAIQYDELPAGISPESLLEGGLELGELIDPALVDQFVGELSLLPQSTAIWLAQHLPATMPPAGMGSGISLGDGIGFSAGIIPIRLGFFNQFDKVFADLEVLDYIADVAPALMVWPQIGVTAGVGLGPVELSGDFQFLPESDVTLIEGISLSLGVISAGATLRWRINAPMGPLPAFIIGCSGSYYQGSMTFSAGHSGELPLEALSLPTGVDTVTMEGSFSFSTVTTVNWEIYQVNPEIRLAWEIGPFQPFIGVGLGFAFGEVAGQADVRADIEITAVGGLPFNQTLDQDLQSTSGSSQSDYTTSPAEYTFHPHVGFDIDLGLFALTAQVNLAVMGGREIQDVTLSDIGNATSKGADTSIAVVSTLSARIQL